MKISGSNFINNVVSAQVKRTPAFCGDSYQDCISDDLRNKINSRKESEKRVDSVCEKANKAFEILNSNSKPNRIINKLDKISEIPVELDSNTENGNARPHTFVFSKKGYNRKNEISKPAIKISKCELGGTKNSKALSELFGLAYLEYLQTKDGCTLNKNIENVRKDLGFESFLSIKEESKYTGLLKKIHEAVNTEYYDFPYERVEETVNNLKEKITEEDCKAVFKKLANNRKVITKDHIANAAGENDTESFRKNYKASSLFSSAAEKLTEKNKYFNNLDKDKKDKVTELLVRSCKEAIKNEIEAAKVSSTIYENSKYFNFRKDYLELVESAL